MSSNPSDHINRDWLKQLLAFKPAKWVWGRSIRAAIGVGLPLAIGIATGHVAESLFVSMGSLTQAPGERDEAYQFTFLKILLSAICGALGLLLGYLGFLPWIVIIAIMMVLAFFSTIISFHSSVLSSGCMMILMFGTIALCNPDITSFFPLAGFFILGSAFYALMLGIEAIFSGDSPRRKLLINLLAALQKLAQSRAQGQMVEADREQVTTLLDALYHMMMETRFNAWGASPQSEQTAAIVQKADALFTLILGTEKSDLLTKTADNLKTMHDMLAIKGSIDHQQIVTAGGRIGISVDQLAASITNKRAFVLNNMNVQTPQSASLFDRLRMTVDIMSVGKDKILSALAFALCLGIGLSFHFIDRVTHWYWIPMTIVIVMRPDLGSVFGRTILRCIGTSAGVLIGAAILIFVPLGATFVAILAIIACLMPWAIQKSYALFSLVLTPLVLVLIDYVSPETTEANYAIWRFADTLTGGIIVIIFGYLIWPKQKYETFERSFKDARSAITHYLENVLNKATDNKQNDTPNLVAVRRLAYGKLSDMRANLQKTLGDPPPAGLQAIVWYPVITSMERLCDSITSYSVTNINAEYNAHDKALNNLVLELKGSVKGLSTEADTKNEDDDITTKFITDMQSEIAHLNEWHQKAITGKKAVMMRSAKN
ncbi:FUSC family protein [Brucellaceae bacterium C25G]